MRKPGKIIVSVFVVTALMLLTVVPFGAIEIKRYFGDLNNDSYVTTSDAIVALSVAANIHPEELVGMDFEAADMDNDNEITTKDARLILKTAAGQIKKRQMEGYEFDENASDFLKRVNTYRLEEDSTNTTLKLSSKLSSAAKAAAKEYATKTGNALVRADNSYYYKLLDERDISYTYADKIIIASSFGYKETFNALIENQQSKKAICNGSFKKFGIGAYSTDGHTFYWCIFLTD